MGLMSTVGAVGGTLLGGPVGGVIGYGMGGGDVSDIPVVGGALNSLLNGPPQVSPGSEYTGFDPSQFVMGHAGADQYGLGGVAGTFQNRQIDPATQAMLLAQANGSAPSAAESLLGEGLRRNQAQAMSTAFSNPSVAPALAMRQALDAQTNMGLRTQSDMAAMRASEQARGQSMLANWQMQQQNQNDEMVRYFQGLGYSMDEAQMKANMALQSMKFQAHEGQQNRVAGASQQNAANQQAQNAAVIGAAGAAAGAAIGGPPGAVLGNAAGQAVAGGGAAPAAAPSYGPNPSMSSGDYIGYA